MGSAEVWDEHTRAQRAACGGAAPAEPPRAERLELPADELVALVAGIVQVTLDTRRTQQDLGERSELARALEARLLSLFGASAEPEAAVAEAPDEPAAEEVLAVAEPEAAPLLPPDASPAQRAFAAALEERLTRLGGALAARSDLRARLVALALERMPTASPPAGASPEELRGLDVLQRRAAKLERSLQESRAALAYVSGLEHVDQGIASIYRAVQGLALGDPQHERKRAVLASVFQANLALQKPGC